MLFAPVDEDHLVQEKAKVDENFIKRAESIIIDFKRLATSVQVVAKEGQPLSVKKIYSTSKLYLDEKSVKIWRNLHQIPVESESISSNETKDHWNKISSAIREELFDDLRITINAVFNDKVDLKADTQATFEDLKQRLLKLDNSLSM